MIRILNHRDPPVARMIHELQLESYAVEARLIGYDRIPYMLHDETHITVSQETFAGYISGDTLAGLTSFEIDEGNMTICRMAVSPVYFRQGIAAKLLRFLESHKPDIKQIYVQTAARNHPAIRLYEKAGFYVDEYFFTPDRLKIVRLKKSFFPARDIPRNSSDNTPE